VAAVSFGAGGASYNWASRGHTLSVGGEAVTATELRYAEDRKGSFSSRTEAANAGYFFLANFRANFDYSQGKLCLEKAAHFELPPMNRSGLGVSKDEPAFFSVVQLRANSPGAAAGVLQGDHILAVDGQVATELSYDDMYRIVRGAPGTHVRLNLVRNGQPVDAEIVLQDPI
jgi:predicted metalloprotease with PDZ domain